MKLIIDIPDREYKQRTEFPLFYDSTIDKAIANGTPLEEELENQKTGHWISDTVDGWFKCSECEHLELGKTIYCSSCGAKMKGENNE